MIPEYIIYLITTILLGLIILKTVLFFSNTITRKSFINWFFFSNYALYNSRSDKSRKSKMLQNKLTWFIIGVAVIDVVVFILIRNAT